MNKKDGKYQARDAIGNIGYIYRYQDFTETKVWLALTPFPR
jgi:hypothetical protein